MVVRLTQEWGYDTGVDESATEAWGDEMGRVPILPARSRALRTDGDTILFEARLRRIGRYRYEVSITEQAMPDVLEPGDPGPFPMEWRPASVRWGLRRALRSADRQLDRRVLHELRKGSRVVSTRAVTPDMRGPA